MIGSIAGGIIGSVYEHAGIKRKDFPLFRDGCGFTDDTVLTVAIADVILRNRPYVDLVRQIGRRYPGAGYGGSFAPGGIAEAFYGRVPEVIRDKVRELLPPDLWEITEAFCQRYRS